MIEVNYKNGMDETEECNRFEYEELMTKYKSDIEKGLVSNECIENILAYFMKIGDGIKSSIEWSVKIIYMTLISEKYFRESGCADIGSIVDIVREVSSLKNIDEAVQEINLLKDGKIGFYNIYQICKDVYDYLMLEVYYNYEEVEKKPFEEQEELHPEHLLDAKYYLDLLREWNSGDKEFDKVLDKELWRYI